MPRLPRVEGMELGLGHGSRAMDPSHRAPQGTPGNRAQRHVTQSMTQRLRLMSKHMDEWAQITGPRGSQAWPRTWIQR